MVVGAPAHRADAAGAEPSEGWYARWRRVWPAVAPAVVFLAVRQVGVLILAMMAPANDTTLTRSLTAWDGQWYLGIARGGYDTAPSWLADADGGRTDDTPLAFFPAYPTLVGWLDSLPLVGLAAAGLAVATVGGVLAAYGIARIGEHVDGGSRRTGLILVALFAASPMGVVLSMAYSEALFCAAAAWALVFVLRRNWIAAGACCAAAGLVRPTALALIVAVGLAAVVGGLVRAQYGRGGRAGVLAGCVLAPAGLLGYLWWAGSRIVDDGGIVDRIGGWSTLQRQGWGTWFDGGVATAQYVGQALASAQPVLEIGTVLVLVGAVVLAVLCAVHRVPWPLLVYGVAVLVMNVGSNGLMNSKARLLLPAFTLLIPVAIGLARRKPATALLVLSAVAVASGWFGAHALVVWSYAI